MVLLMERAVQVEADQTILTGKYMSDKEMEIFHKEELEEILEEAVEEEAAAQAALVQQEAVAVTEERELHNLELR